MWNLELSCGPVASKPFGRQVQRASGVPFTRNWTPEESGYGVTSVTSGWADPGSTSTQVAEPSGPGTVVVVGPTVVVVVVGGAVVVVGPVPPTTWTEEYSTPPLVQRASSSSPAARVMFG